MSQKTITQITASLVLAALFLIAACDKNPAEKKIEPPSLPPSETMKVDLSVFTATPSLAKAVDSTKYNFNNAAVRVGVINTLVLLALAPPVATFAAAASQTPVLHSDGKFHWIYTVQSNGQSYEADLAGYIDAAEARIRWEMYVTIPTMVPPLNHFLWYEGWSNITNTEGQWHFYDVTKPLQKAEVITLDWTFKGYLDRTAKFTNVSSVPAATGDILEYKVAGTACSITFFNNSESTTSLIQWDSVTTAGFLQVHIYHNGEAAYWDQNHYDVN